MAVGDARRFPPQDVVRKEIEAARRLPGHSATHRASGFGVFESDERALCFMAHPLAGRAQVRPCTAQRTAHRSRCTAETRASCGSLLLLARLEPALLRFDTQDVGLLQRDGIPQFARRPSWAPQAIQSRITRRRASFAPQPVPTLMRRARCDSGMATGHTSRHRPRRRLCLSQGAQAGGVMRRDASPMAGSPRRCGFNPDISGISRSGALPSIPGGKRCLPMR